jgi:ABC-type transport system substrate-binding protein
VKFHNVSPVNGRVMDMEDWKTTIERFLALSAQREPLTELLDKVEYPDSTHMVWKLKFAYAPLVDRIWSERLAFQVLPRELNLNDNLAASTSVGTGFKILDKHQPSVTMEYRKNPDFWGGEVFMDRWHFPIIPEYANRYAQFVSGNIINFSPNARDVLAVAKDVPGAVIVMNPIPDDNFSRLRFGRFEFDQVPTKDPRVRIAIRRSVNFKGIGEFLANKQQFEAAGIPVELLPRTHVNKGLSFWLNPENGELGALSANYLFDVAEAKKLTTAAGFSGAVDVDFNPLATGGAIPEGDRLIVDQMNQSGVFKVKENIYTNSVQHRDCRSLGQCVGLVQSSISDDVDYVLRDQHKNGPRPGGEPAYPNAEYDRLADAYRREQDPGKRIQILKDIQLVQAGHFTTIPYIHQYTSFSFRWPWVHNLNHGEATSGNPVWGGHKQWLDADMPRRNG